MFDDYLPTQQGRIQAYKDRISYWDRLVDRAFARMPKPHPPPTNPPPPPQYTLEDYGFDDGYDDTSNIFGNN